VSVASMRRNVQRGRSLKGENAIPSSMRAEVAVRLAQNFEPQGPPRTAALTGGWGGRRGKEESTRYEGKSASKKRVER